MPKAIAPAVVWVLLGTALPTAADPITIISGSYSVTAGEDGEWLLMSSTAAMRGSGLGEVLPFWNCLRCLPGDPVSLDARLSGPQADPGTATWEGRAYDRVFWNTDFAFESGSAAAGAGVVDSRPFTFTGSLAAFSDEARTSPLFAATLVGSGLARIRFFRDLDAGAAEVFSVSYEFAQAPAPVPEPASLLLLGSGLTAVLARRRVPRASTHEENEP